MSEELTKVYLELNATHRSYVSDRNVVLERFSPSIEKTKKLSKAKDSPSVGTGEFTKDTYELVGYYPTHQAMLIGFVDSELKQCDQRVEELLRKVDELYRLIEGGGCDD